ncbi:MAG TPA: c-type cytochrome [Caulobacteraceae bacterium]|nr:c-type cytochrome [Caulobacteraceae bacterium]
MTDNDPPFTAVQIYLRKRMWKLELAIFVFVLLAVLGLAAIVTGAGLWMKYGRSGAPTYADNPAHFMYGSIGAETKSGLPYWLWKALPAMYPADFKGRSDYTAFGFVYEKDASGRQADLPIGISRRTVNGVDLVWFNCATCHVGTWRESAGAAPHVVPGMPSNNLDLYRFSRFVLNLADDEKLAPDNVFAAMEKAGARFSPLDRLVWQALVLPQLREGLIERRNRLAPLLEAQPPWGPGRVDTFNPYKLLLQLPPGSRIPDAELVGASDFPSIFDQRPREGMQLHWDGNNDSLAERNLSAAIGAGVTPETVDHASIERDASWLLDLRPPPSPYHPDPAALARGKQVFMQGCASCHGWQGPNGYVFQGAALGKVQPESDVATDPNRLNSYTQSFRDWQVATLFAGTPYHFTHFVKTNGYANLPLDGLWLRAPYLHNGSVPTLADLLKPPAERPKAFVRGLDVIDPTSGGFTAPPCTPGQPLAAGFCFDVSQRGNSNAGHPYGTTLPAAQKQDLLAYLETF